MDIDPPELDCLRWYVDFESCDTVLWEKFFHCWDLGRDLVPVVQQYHASEEKTTRVPGSNVVPEAQRPLQQDTTTSVPDPFSLQAWLDAHAAELAAGASLSLFGAAHPDKEFDIQVVGGGGPLTHGKPWHGDTWLFQLQGTVTVTLEGKTAQQLFARHSGVVPPNTAYTVERAPGSIGLVITMDPSGNRP